MVLITVPFLRAYGQVELIVRPSDGAKVLVRALDDPASKASAVPELFEGVSDVQPLVASQPGKAGSSPVPAYTLSVPDSASFRTLMQQWDRRSDVEYVQPNYRYELDGSIGSGLRQPRHGTRQVIQGDPLADSLDHFPVIRVREAWEMTTGHPDVRIGLVDTGLLMDHPDLAEQVWVNPGEDLNGNGQADPGDFNGADDDGNGLVDDLAGYDFVDRPEEVEAGDFAGRDPDPSPDPGSLIGGHGTFVAGVMSAARDNGVGIAGVAPGARLVPLRAFGGDGRGATDDIAAAIIYAAQMDLDVINLSFGRDYAAPVLEESIKYAVSQGTVVVASAGNNGGDEPHYPSDYPEVISVAWLTADGTDIAGRGEFGIDLDLGAPGTAIYSTITPPPDSVARQSDVERYYGRRSGSSVAAPQVAGAAALLRSLDPTLSPAAVRSILTASAVDLRDEGWDHHTAAGRLDVASAVARALPARTEITRPAHNGGTAADELAIVGSALDPAFVSYSVYYAEGSEDLDQRPDPWVRIAGPVEHQAYRDTLAHWRTGNLPEGDYTLRLATTLRSGRTVEDRRRVFVDRSPPQLTPHLLQAGLIGAHWGVVADVSTDDFTTLTMEVVMNGTSHEVASDVRNFRHGVAWPDTRGRGGRARVRLTAANPSGLTAAYETEVEVPANRINSTLFSGTSTSVPYGFLLPHSTDFDGDQLREVVFNRYEDGALGDTLMAYEWNGTGFSRAGALVANVIPRDVGDTDVDGQKELLTQVGGATLLLEQRDGRAFPDQQVFVDTLGLREPGAPNAVWGARLTDLDGDGRGEILAHNQAQWRVLEERDGNYEEVVRLDNPTGADGADAAIDPNSFQEPEALVDDFDGDGRRDLLVGDSDGDWVMYEATGDDALHVAWTYETDRVNAGARFAKGDFDGDGDLDFVTFTENLNILNDAGEREPPIGLYYFWETTEDDQYELVGTLPVRGDVSKQGSITAADFDGDGRDEVAIAHPPDLYVTEYRDGEGWQPLFQWRPGTGVGGARSPAMVADDFDGDGTPEIIVGTSGPTLQRFVYQPASAVHPPPRWIAAHAVDASHVTLSWRAPNADSVTVLQGPPGASLDRRAATEDSSLVLAETTRQQYALRAWYAGASSPLSTHRVIRPHAPATVTGVDYPEPSTIELTFSERLARDVQTHQFLLDGSEPRSLLRAQEGQVLILRFSEVPSSRSGTLRWSNVHDLESTPVAQTSVSVTFPPPSSETLVLDTWTVVDRQRIRLVFSEPLDPTFARKSGNYELMPRGEIDHVEYDIEQPRQVTLTVRGVVVGATGQEVSLTVTDMRGASGRTLAPEGNVIRLVEPATDLADVYVYPNPYRATRHEGAVTIAGLPAEATVRIISVQGTLIRVLDERGRDGGVEWNLRDRSGRLVPSGVYLIRVESPDHAPVLKKAAIIR